MKYIIPAMKIIVWQEYDVPNQFRTTEERHAGYACVIVDEYDWTYTYSIGLGDEQDCKRLAIQCAQWDRYKRFTNPDQRDYDYSIADLLDAEKDIRHYIQTWEE